MVKEVRYELLKLLEKVSKKAGEEKRKNKDGNRVAFTRFILYLKNHVSDVEREVFMVCCETMSYELKTMGIREEWTLQQRHMGEIQNIIFEMNSEFSQHVNYRSTQGAILMGIFARILEEIGAADQLLADVDVLQYKWLVLTMKEF